MTNKLINTGFTVVELMVSMAIAAILFGYAIPAFNDFTAQRTMTTRVNEFVLAVNFARSEAAKLGGLVSVQAVDASDSDDEWGPGYCVVVGNPGDCDAPVLRNFAALNGLTLDATAGLNDEDTLSFNSRGLMTLGAGGSVSLCTVDDTEDPGRSIGLNIIGRTTTAELICHP